MLQRGVPIYGTGVAGLSRVADKLDAYKSDAKKARATTTNGHDIVFDNDSKHDRGDSTDYEGDYQIGAAPRSSTYPPGCAVLLISLLDCLHLWRGSNRRDWERASRWPQNRAA